MGLNELRTTEDIAKRTHMLLSDETTGMALIDKQLPHAVQDIMWLHAETRPVSTLCEYFQADETGERSQALFAQLAACAQAAEDEGNYVTVSWSHDPLTHHRASIQGEKRLHFHLAARQQELEQLPGITTQVGNLPFTDRRRLAEEYSYITKTLLTDLIAHEGMPFKLKDIHPCVLSLEIGEWNTLKNPELIAMLESFIGFMETQYTTVIDAIGKEGVDGIVHPERRSNYEQRISYATGLDIDSCGAQMLANFIRQVRPWCNDKTIQRVEQFVDAVQDNGRDGSKRKHLYSAIVPLQGLAFAAGFSRWKGVLYLHVRMCKFSDLGGAGCAIIDGMPVRVKKSKEEMDSAQVRSRKKFMQLVLDTAAAG